MAMPVLASTLRVLHRFTVDDYHRMADAGVLGEDDRVELIEGEMVDLPAGIVEVWTEPGTAGYGHIRRVSADGSLSPQAFPDVVLAVDDLLA